MGTTFTSHILNNTISSNSGSVQQHDHVSQSHGPRQGVEVGFDLMIVVVAESVMEFGKVKEVSGSKRLLPHKLPEEGR